MPVPSSSARSHSCWDKVEKAKRAGYQAAEAIRSGTD
jgi:hypothetical protein